MTEAPPQPKPLVYIATPNVDASLAGIRLAFERQSGRDPVALTRSQVETLLALAEGKAK